MILYIYLSLMITFALMLKIDRKIPLFEKIWKIFLIFIFWPAFLATMICELYDIYIDEED